MGYGRLVAAWLLFAAAAAVALAQVAYGKLPAGPSKELSTANHHLGRIKLDGQTVSKDRAGEAPKQVHHVGPASAEAGEQGPAPAQGKAVMVAQGPAPAQGKTVMVREGKASGPKSKVIEGTILTADTGGGLMFLWVRESGASNPPFPQGGHSTWKIPPDAPITYNGGKADFQSLFRGLKVQLTSDPGSGGLPYVAKKVDAYCKFERIPLDKISEQLRRWGIPEGDINAWDGPIRRINLVGIMGWPNGRTSIMQGAFRELTTEQLIDLSAILLFFRDTRILEESGIQYTPVKSFKTVDDVRNTLIHYMNRVQDIPVKELQAKSNRQLLTQAQDYYLKTRTVKEVLELHFDPDPTQVVQMKPETVETKYLINRGSTPVTRAITVAAEFTDTSVFSREHGFQVGVGIETGWAVGDPRAVGSHVKVSFTASTAHKWTVGQTNTIARKFSDTLTVTTRGNTASKVSLVVQRGHLSVPYVAKIRTEDGTTREISGTWEGVSSGSSRVVIDDVPIKEALEEGGETEHSR
jgi:hypothetical protein